MACYDKHSPRGTRHPSQEVLSSSNVIRCRRPSESGRQVSVAVDEIELSLPLLIGDTSESKEDQQEVYIQSNTQDCCSHVIIPLPVRCLKSEIMAQSPERYRASSFNSLPIDQVVWQVAERSCLLNGYILS